jgi:hypothetical protein
LEGVHELPLVQSLIEQRRRFIKPLRYDAQGAARFPGARQSSWPVERQT